MIYFDRIDLGCGASRKDGYLGFDNLEAAEYQGMTEEDREWIIEWDLNKGIPMPDNSINDVYIGHFLEHVISPTFLLYEVHRVCKHGAHVEIYVPLHEMKSVGHLTEFHQYWFEDIIASEFRGIFSVVRKNINANKKVMIKQQDSIVAGYFDELNILLKVIK